MRVTTDRLIARLESAVEGNSAGQSHRSHVSGASSKMTKTDIAGEELTLQPEDGQMATEVLELQSLYKIALQMQRQASSETFAQEVIRILDENMAYDNAAIYLAKKSGGSLKAIAQSGRFVESNDVAKGEASKETALLPGKSITSWVAQTGRSVCVGDVSRDPRYLATLEEIRSALCVPMRSAGRVIGVIVVESPEIDAFDDSDKLFMETVASQVAVAIENAWLSSEVKKYSSQKEGDSGPLNDEQEDLIRNLEQQNEELAQINTTVMAQNQELNAFSHTVAHDLKNPLAILMGFAEVLSEDYVGGENELLGQGIQVILENGVRLENIIDELLLLAEVRQLEEIDLVPLAMANIVSETRKRLSNLIDESEASIIFPFSWPSALGHRPWVQEIWVNYVSNAIKYGGRPPKIELGATKQLDGMVRFWVQDNGPGISLEDQRRLFVPFTQLYQVRAQGHGLGLSIVRRIATKLGGEAGVEGQPGEGSLFWFTLPTADEENQE